jgi:hypothetical protein
MTLCGHDSSVSGFEFFMYHSRVVHAAAAGAIMMAGVITATPPPVIP